MVFHLLCPGFRAVRGPLEETLHISLPSPPEGGVSLKSVVAHIYILSDSLSYRTNNITGRILCGRRFSAANRTIKISFYNEFLTVGREFLQPAEGVNIWWQRNVAGFRKLYIWIDSTGWDRSSFPFIAAGSGRLKTKRWVFVLKGKLIHREVMAEIALILC